MIILPPAPERYDKEDQDEVRRILQLDGGSGSADAGVLNALSKDVGALQQEVQALDGRVDALEASGWGTLLDLVLGSDAAEWRVPIPQIEDMAEIEVEFNLNASAGGGGLVRFAFTRSGAAPANEGSGRLVTGGPPTPTVSGWLNTVIQTATGTGTRQLWGEASWRRGFSVRALAQGAGLGSGASGEMVLAQNSTFAPEDILVETTGAGRVVLAGSTIKVHGRRA